MNNLAIILMLVTSYAIPGVAALLTAAKWPSAVTGVISLVLASFSGFLTEAQAEPHYDWKHGALLALGSLVTALIAHKQLWDGALANWLHSFGSKVTDLGPGSIDDPEPVADIPLPPITPSDPDQPAAGVPPPVDPNTAGSSAPTADPAPPAAV